jgi:dienelactone hydrolase
LFTPAESSASVGALVIGGSGGSEPWYVAEALAGRGIAALSVAYFGRPDLPDTLSRIPIEYFGRALEILSFGLGKLGRLVTVGMSRGSEAAVLAAVHGGADVAGVILSVPANVSFGGWPNGGPAWLIHGRAVPWSDDPEHDLDAGAASLPVEKVNGPLLLISAGADEVWPSALMATAIVDRLRKFRHRHGSELLEYASARHALGYLVPHLPDGLLPTELSDDDATQRARNDVWPRLLSFLERLRETRGGLT